MLRFVCVLVCVGAVLGLSVSHHPKHAETGNKLKDQLRAYVKAVHSDPSIATSDAKKQTSEAKSLILDLEQVSHTMGTAKRTMEHKIGIRSAHIRDFVKNKFKVDEGSLSTMLDKAVSHISDQSAHPNHDLERRSSSSGHSTPHHTAKLTARQTLDLEKKNIRKVISTAMQAVAGLGKEVSAASKTKAISQAQHKKFTSSLSNLARDLEKVDKATSTKVAERLAKNLLSQIDEVNSMASALHPETSTKSAKAAKTHTTKPEKAAKAAKPTLDLEKSASVTLSALEQGKAMLEHAREVVKAAKDLKGPALLEANGNVAHMETDVEMMQATHNEEAISDLLQALKMRNEKVAKLESSLSPVNTVTRKVIATEPAAAADAMSAKAAKTMASQVRAKLSDLERTDVARSISGHIHMSSLRDALTHFENSKSDVDRDRYAAKMEDSLSKLKHDYQLLSNPTPASSHSLEENNVAVKTHTHSTFDVGSHASDETASDEVASDEVASDDNADDDDDVLGADQDVASSDDAEDESEAAADGDDKEMEEEGDDKEMEEDAGDDADEQAADEQPEAADEGDEQAADDGDEQAADDGEEDDGEEDNDDNADATATAHLEEDGDEADEDGDADSEAADQNDDEEAKSDDDAASLEEHEDEDDNEEDEVVGHGVSSQDDNDDDGDEGDVAQASGDDEQADDEASGENDLEEEDQGLFESGVQTVNSLTNGGLDKMAGMLEDYIKPHSMLKTWQH